MESEAVKGYLNEAPESYDGIKIRNMTESEFRFGEVIIYGLIQLGLLYGPEAAKVQVV